MTSFELSPQICHYVEQRLDLRIVCGELCSSQEKYQAILAMDVFEHLPDPDKFLQDCSERLEPDGILVLQTPCYNPVYTYEEMLVKQPRFQHLLVEEQHVFLYSRESIVHLLKRHGFTHVIFEPAFFGNDYDMFLFASKAPFGRNTAEEIDDYLNHVPNGRMVKALFRLLDEKNQEMDQRRAIDEQRNIVLKDMDILNQLVQEKETQIAQYKKAAQERLEDIYKLTDQNAVLKHEADRRLADIERLLEENKLLKHEADQRLADVEKLTSENAVLEQAANDRLAIIERMKNE